MEDIWWNAYEDVVDERMKEWFDSLSDPIIYTVTIPLADLSTSLSQEKYQLKAGETNQFFDFSHRKIFYCCALPSRFV